MLIIDMNLIRWILLIVYCGVLTAIVVACYNRSIGFGNRSTGFGLVVTRDVPRNHLLQESDLQVVATPISNLVGRYTRNPLSKGDRIAQDSVSDYPLLPENGVPLFVLLKSSEANAKEIDAGSPVRLCAGAKTVVEHVPLLAAVCHGSVCRAIIVLGPSELRSIAEIGNPDTIEAWPSYHKCA